MNVLEWRATGGLAAVYAARMLGLFMILPVFALFARDLVDATPVRVGLALGVYGLTQAALQIPFGVASDRIGRKPVIVFGLLLFAAGSLLAAVSRDLDWIIAGRALQGSGAIAAASNALLADLTRAECRTQAMLVVGIAIGAAFTGALILGPVLGAWIGVPGIFAVTALLALACIPLVWFVVPRPAAGRGRTHAGIGGDLRAVLAAPQLLRLDLGVFILHACLTAIFLAVPAALSDRAGLPVGDHWRVYLPVMLASLALTLPLMHLAERRGHLRRVFLFAVTLLAAAVLLMTWAQDALWSLIAVLLLFFGAFNLLEASLPSLLSRLCDPALRGAGMGVFSSCQFLGAFAGGVLGGVAQSCFGNTGIFLGAAALCLGWLLVAAGLRPPVAPGRVPEAN
jgi:MFS family permease